jgi:hypothetical protein
MAVIMAGVAGGGNAPGNRQGVIVRTQNSGLTSAALSGILWVNRLRNRLTYAPANLSRNLPQDS